MAAQAKPPKSPARKPAGTTDQADDQADTNGNGNAPRTMLAVPQVGREQKVSHDKVVAPEVLAAADEADRTRLDRASQVWGDADQLTPALLRKLMPLLREDVSPRNIVTTGEVKGKPYVSTGIQSVQVQIDRLVEVLGLDHFRLLSTHTADGTRCHVHLVIGNRLQWARLVDDQVVPYTVLDQPAAGNSFETAEVIAYLDGWGGHERGSQAADKWKGSFTNAAKLVIARSGPGNHVYRLEFEDDPSQPEQKASRGRDRARSEAADQVAKTEAKQQEPPDVADPAKALEELLEADSPLQAKRREAVKALGFFTDDPAAHLRRLLPADTDRKLDDLIRKANQAADAAAAQG